MWLIEEQRVLWNALVRSWRAGLRPGRSGTQSGKGSGGCSGFSPFSLVPLPSSSWFRPVDSLSCTLVRRMWLIQRELGGNLETALRKTGRFPQPYTGFPSLQQGF